MQRLAPIVALLSWACTAITDFDSQPHRTIDIADSLADPDTVALRIEGDLALLELAFSDPLPEDHRNALSDLLGDALRLSIVNLETNASLQLETQVDGIPDAPEEYTIDVLEDDKTVFFTFFNAAEDGEPIQPEGGRYAVLLEIRDNDYFAMDTLAIDVVFE